MRLHRGGDPLCSGNAEAGAEAAADHDRVEIEQVDRRTDTGAERLHGAVDQPRRELVAAHERRGPDAARQAIALVLAHQLEQFRLRSFRLGPPGAPLHRRAAGGRLEAALPAARARGSVHPDDDVPELSRGAAAEPELAVDHDRAADAGAPPDAEERAIRPPRAEEPLGFDGDADVVAERDADTELLAQRGGQRKRAGPVRQIPRAGDGSRGAVDLSR